MAIIPIAVDLLEFHKNNIDFALDEINDPECFRRLANRSLGRILNCFATYEKELIKIAFEDIQLKIALLEFMGNGDAECI